MISKRAGLIPTPTVFFRKKTIHELSESEQPCPDGISLAYLRLAAKLNRKQCRERLRHNDIHDELIANVEDRLTSAIAGALILEEELLAVRLRK